MANYNVLKAAVASVIYDNYNNEITGVLLQETLLSIINVIGDNYQFSGIATPETAPGTPDQNVFYIAAQSGEYVNFDSINVEYGEVAVLLWKNSQWTKESVDIASSEIVRKIGTDVPRGIFSKTPIEHHPVGHFIDLSIENPVSGKLYYVQIYNTSGWQQLTMFRTTPSNPTGYDEFCHLKDIFTSDTGIQRYVAEAEWGDGEKFTIVINWDLLPVSEESNYTYYPNEYTFDESVFFGGLIYHKLRPEGDIRTDKTLTIEDMPADAKAVGDIILPEERYWAACGDSITNANHPGVDDVSDSDLYCPIDGYDDASPWKRKNYAYYIAKKNKIHWANYGWGGTTLHHCAPKAYPYPEHDFNPFVDTRMTQLKPGVDWDYISLFFGWNDCAFGPVYQRDLWLQSQYGQDIGYPVTAEQIGASGFATQAQKDACDAATGTVGGVYYDNADDYFFACFVGTINDTTKNTWMGAWNNALEYLMKKYTKAKILVIAPYVAEHSTMIRNSVHAIAEKWGVTCFDFEDLAYWIWRTTPNYTELRNPDDANGFWYSANGTNFDANINGYNTARMTYDGLHPSNLGYKTIAGPIGDKLMNG